MSLQLLQQAILNLSTQTTMSVDQLLRKMNILTPYKREDVLCGIALICEELFGPDDVQEPDCIPWTQECYKLTPDTEDNNFEIRCDFILYGSSGNVTKLLATAHKAPTYLIEEALEQLLKLRLFNWAMYLYYHVNNEEGTNPCDEDFDSPEWNTKMFNVFVGFKKGDPDYYDTWEEVLNVYKDGTLSDIGLKSVVKFLVSSPQKYSYCS